MLIKYSWQAKTKNPNEIVDITVDSENNYVPPIDSLVIINRIIEGEHLEIKGRVKDLWFYESENKVSVFID